MKNRKPVQPAHKPLLGLFLKGYEPMRLKMEEECRPELLKLAPLVFAKWYFTALAADTILSPANILQQNLEQTGSPDTEYAYVLEADPKKEDDELYSFGLYEYSLREHPLVEDLKTLIRFCTPDRENDEHGLLLPEDREELLQELSFRDEFYLEYLTRLAWMQKLLRAMPALHTRKVQPSEACEAFFAQTTEEILSELAYTACTLTAERFTYTMELDHDIATPDFFYGCLERHMDSDRIFIDFYHRVDVDIDTLWRKQPEFLTEEERAIISSFLFAGIMLDKWFLTPMGSFFHFIRPISFMPMRFFRTVNTLAALHTMKHNPGTEIFMPASYYSLTALGKALFADEKNIGEDKQKMPAVLPYSQILQTVQQETEIRAHEMTYLFEAIPDIVSFRVYPKQDREFWKEAEVSQDMSVDTFCRDICSAFGYEISRSYLLIVPNETGFPVEYSPSTSRRSLNRTDKKNMEDLPLSAGKQLILKPDFMQEETLLLDVKAVSDGDPFIMYPRITGQSDKVVEAESFDELF